MFEEYVKKSHFRDIILDTINFFQGQLFTLTGGAVDMDKIQKVVHDSTPDFNLQGFVVACLLSFAFWMVMYYIQYLLIIEPLMNSQKKSYKFPAHYLKKNRNDRMYYVTVWNANLHSTLSTLGSLYCFIYADGVSNTTWFHCNFFKLTMFPLQKYLCCFSVGYLLQDIVVCLIW